MSLYFGFHMPKLIGVVVLLKIIGCHLFFKQATSSWDVGLNWQGILMPTFLPWLIKNDVQPVIVWRAATLICRGRNVLLLWYVINWCVNVCINKFCVCVFGRSSLGEQTVLM